MEKPSLKDTDPHYLSYYPASQELVLKALETLPLERDLSTRVNFFPFGKSPPSKHSEFQEYLLFCKVHQVLPQKILFTYQSHKSRRKAGPYMDWLNSGPDG